MKKTALLIDGGWFAKGLGAQFQPKASWPTAEQVCRNARCVLSAEEELFRIFYYDCEPFEACVTNPADKSVLNYAGTASFAGRKKFFQEMGQMDFVALRRGELKARGWELTEKFKKALIKGNAAPFSATDIYPAFQQKGVDMRIGIDVATLSLKRLVDRIILFSGDTDMIPAMKLARREGVQVFVVKLGSWPLKDSLIEDADGIRALTPAP
ncbi:MAG: NYN domain-containing protein [Terrimicrobiaceae bacterium]